MRDMAAAVAGRADGAAGCLCVLCGLPAAGKSTLASRIVCAAAEQGWRGIVIPYDNLIPEHAFRIKGGEDSQDMHTEWKSHRRAVLQCIQQFLEDPDVRMEQQSCSLINNTAWEKCIQSLTSESFPSDEAPFLFLLDDNFYYPSMRYEVFQLARKYSLGFCQIYLQCDLESCMRRNHSRSQPIPADVMLEMAKRLEPPNTQKNSWETQSLSINTSSNLSKCDIQRVMDLISSALNNPLSAAEDNTEQKLYTLQEADRQKCANSVVHQADQACRRLISEAMKTAKDYQITSEDMRSLATQLNESKAGLLHHLRQQLLQEAIFIQEENLNVDLIKNRAVSIFNENKKEILAKFIKNQI
ncbi:L-seryl-tRNA(Sec) kinase [Oryzias melastigma]|uniref:L-seryl-tRNA(Sec) kinase n=1 Tax=Oryzias melastigma TaxID=30732 RepID=A0A834BY44_ORYME|nr:L-seryl-tRNA(Sec) kinase [Oryzias melastigma]